MNERVIVWGVGDYYSRYREDIFRMNVVALVDNDIKKQDTILDGLKVISPQKVQDMLYDKIYIMSTSINVIKQQMLELEIPKEKIHYFFDLEQRNLHPICLCEEKKLFDKKVAIVSHEFTATGAPNCLLQLTKYMLKNGWNVKVGSAYDGDIKKEFQKIGAECLVDERLLMGTLENIEWVNESDLIIVNTVLLYYLLRKRNLSIPLIWWLHEPALLYKSVVPEIINSLPTENLHVYTVSKVADEAFCEICKTVNTRQFLYGIEDCKKAVISQQHESIRFVIIGAISKLKGHDVLLDALKVLDKKELDKCEFILIGNNESDFAKQILHGMEKLKVKFCSTGVISHEETLLRLAEADVLICASRVETMSMSVTEAMMLGKPVLVTSAAGIIEYIVDGVNGYIFQSEDKNLFAQKIRLILNKRRKLDAVGKAGRKVYEKVFILSRFEKCMDEILSSVNLNELN